MSVSLKQSYDIEYDGTANVARMDLFADAAGDLTGLTTVDGITLLQGSTAHDISTGDVYMMQTNGTWVKQPSASSSTDSYTKAEIDNMITAIYQTILYYHTTQTSTDGTITFYALTGVVESLSIYGNAQQGGTPVFVGDLNENLSIVNNTSYNLNNWYFQDTRLTGVLPAGTYTISFVTDSITAGTTTDGTIGTGTTSNYTDDLEWFTREPAGDMTSVTVTLTESKCIWARFVRDRNIAQITCTVSISQIRVEEGTTAYCYRIPITCGEQAITLCLDAPLRKALDDSNAVDVLSNDGTIIREVDASGNALEIPTTETIDFPVITVVDGENTLTVGTNLPPSLIEISGGNWQ